MDGSDDGVCQLTSSSYPCMAAGAQSHDHYRTIGTRGKRAKVFVASGGMQCAYGNFADSQKRL
jgi:hypothetical protein